MRQGYLRLVALRERLFGRKKDFRDPSIFHHVSLVAFFAWVGLGADGLSSSAYGPEEAFKSLGDGHRYMALFLALAVAVTVFIISYGVQPDHRAVPAGRRRLRRGVQAPRRVPGLVSGSALLVDYVLTIAVSVASAGDAVFSFLPPAWHHYKLAVGAGRARWPDAAQPARREGVDPRPDADLPGVPVTHAVLIIGAVGSNLGEAGTVASCGVDRAGDTTSARSGSARWLLIFMRAFALGGGTFTGIEAVSNGLGIMREPRVRTGKRTMVLMATSLSLTAGGILLAYLLLGVDRAVAAPGTRARRLNAILADLFAGHWTIGGLAVGKVFVIVTLLSEGALLSSRRRPASSTGRA